MLTMTDICKCCERRPATDDGLCEQCAGDREVEKLMEIFEERLSHPQYGPEPVQLEREGV